MDWGIEVAKQFPALGVLVWVVIHFLAHIEKGRELSEKRIKEICEGHEKRIDEMHDREAEALKTVSAIIATNNEVLGSIKTLLTMQVTDERIERQSHPRRSETPYKPQ